MYWLSSKTLRKLFSKIDPPNLGSSNPIFKTYPLSMVYTLFSCETENCRDIWCEEKLNFSTQQWRQGTLWDNKRQPALWKFLETLLNKHARSLQCANLEICRFCGQPVFCNKETTRWDWSSHREVAPSSRSYLDCRPCGHCGLVAGSRCRQQLSWPRIHLRGSGAPVTAVKSTNMFSCRGQLRPHWAALMMLTGDSVAKYIVTQDGLSVNE